MKTAETLLTQFWVIIYITSDFSFNEQSTNFIDSILVTTNITSEFNFNEENRHFIWLVLGNNLRN